MAEIENIHCPICTQLVAKWSSPSIGDQRATGCDPQLLVSLGLSHHLIDLKVVVVSPGV